MDKVLYISIADDSNVNGGALCRKSNYLALKNNTVNFFEYRIALSKKLINKIILSIFNYKNGLSSFHVKRVINIIKEKGIDVVFLDTSLYGKLVKAIRKRTSAKCITFFHNCEYKIYSQSIKNKPWLKPLLKSVYTNEYYSMKYSNRCVFLTERDYDDCKGLYSVDCSPFFTPISLETEYCNNSTISFKKPKKLLFIGSYFYPNIHGLKWFINLVLPYIDYSLTIIGKGFEQNEFLKDLNDKSKLEIKGFVENIKNAYEEADIVIQPVFEGSGMKTKTAECFMYGKPLVSSSEGLVGYIDNCENVYRCDTVESFINTLKASKE